MYGYLGTDWSDAKPYLLAAVAAKNINAINKSNCMTSSKRKPGLAIIDALIMLMYQSFAGIETMQQIIKTMAGIGLGAGEFR